MCREMVKMSNEQKQDMENDSLSSLSRKTGECTNYPGIAETICVHFITHAWLHLLFET